MNLEKGNQKERVFPLILTLLSLAAFAFAAPRPAHAGPDICVNNSSGTVRIVPSCTVGTNLSPCHAHETCVGSLNGQPFATNESWSSCTESLCIDAPPEGPQGLDGSGGWGWDSVANAPVTRLTVGTPAALTVTVLQPSSDPFCKIGGSSTTGTITLTYSSQDFSLDLTDSGGNTGTDPYPRGGVATFTYTGDFWCHPAPSSQSIAFTFTPQNPTNTALVTATVHVGGQEASETFPIAIVK
jgi:hypothetical protein